MKEQQEKQEEEAAEERKRNKLAYNERKRQRIEKRQKLEQGQSVVMSDEEVDDEIAKLDLREGKCRVVNFEMSGRNAFSVSTNFTCPD